jgi:hypothetical protein
VGFGNVASVNASGRDAKPLARSLRRQPAFIAAAAKASHAARACFSSTCIFVSPRECFRFFAA